MTARTATTVTVLRHVPDEMLGTLRTVLGRAGLGWSYVDLPAGAVPLAQGKHCRQQAFRWGDRVYALQFHVEVTAEIIEMWLDKPRSRRELAELDYIDPAVIREQTPRAIPQMTALAERVLGRFAAMCLS